MTAETHSPADDLRRLISDGALSVDALHTLTGIDPTKLTALLSSGTPAGMALTTTDTISLTADESRRISILSAQLSEGLRIEHDERLQSIFETLTLECGLTLDNLTRLTGVEAHTLAAALHAPDTLSADTKYSLALTGSYLITAANQARGL